MQSQIRQIGLSRLLQGYPSWFKVIRVVRVYLLAYIFCIIDCHICRDIFGRIDIMCCRLPYVSKGALPLKTLVLYIYRLRRPMQYDQPTNNYKKSILSTWSILPTRYPIRFRSSKSSTAFIRAAPGEIDLDSTGGRSPS
jgi:hypothetical protein